MSSQIVTQLELQLNKERDKLDAMMAHLRLDSRNGELVPRSVMPLNFKYHYYKKFPNGIWPSIFKMRLGKVLCVQYEKCTTGTQSSPRRRCLLACEQKNT